MGSPSRIISKRGASVTQSGTSCGMRDNKLYDDCGGDDVTFPQMTIYDSLRLHNVSFGFYMNSTCGAYITFHSIPFHSIPFHSIPFYSISIPFHFIILHEPDLRCACCALRFVFPSSLLLARRELPRPAVHASPRLACARARARARHPIAPLGLRGVPAFARVRLGLLCRRLDRPVETGRHTRRAVNTRAS